MNYATKAEMEEIASLAAKQAVRETFKVLGVDIDNPISVQRDFAHLHDWRMKIEAVSKAMLTAFATIVVTGLGMAVWLAITAVAALKGAK